MEVALATVFEVRDELWKVVEPLIPPVSVPEGQGRWPVPDRVCFNAIVFVLVTGGRVGAPAARARLLGHKGARLRLTVAGQAPSTTCWSTLPAFRWPSA